MLIDKKCEGQQYYFISNIINTDKIICVVEYGTLVYIMPKYNFKDSYGLSYKREENILFEVVDINKKTIKKVITNPDLIFENLLDCINYCGENQIVFGASVVFKEGN